MNGLPELPRSIREIDERAERDLTIVEGLASRTGADDRTPQPGFTVPDLRDFMAKELPPPRFTVEPLIPAGVVTLLGAHGGAGKSVLALTIAAHVAAGKPWAGFTVQRGPSTFVSLEDPADVVLLRLRRIAAEYGLTESDVVDNLRVLDGSDGDAALGAEYADHGVRRMMATARFDRLRELARGSQLVVVDNASDAADLNENDRRMVRAFVRLLGTLARENNAGVLLLAHVDKQAARFGAAGNTYSGSTAWHNSSRSRLALVDSEGRVELRQEKLNMGRPAGATPLRWSTHGVLIPTSTATDTAEQDDDASAVLAALSEAAQRSVNVSTARTGPSNAQRVLEAMDALPECLRGTQGRDRFWRALSRLERDGCAGSEEYRNADRKIRTRFVVVPGAPQVRARSPHTPLTNRRTGSAAGAPVCADSTTGAEPAQTGAACPRCDGEECTHCEVNP